MRERGETPTAQSRVSEFANEAGRAPPRLGELAAATLAIAALAIALQLKSHCYVADLSEDEASHYVSGLAIHDYLLSSLGSSPSAVAVAPIANSPRAIPIRRSRMMRILVASSTIVPGFPVDSTRPGYELLPRPTRRPSILATICFFALLNIFYLTPLFRKCYFV